MSHFATINSPQKITLEYDIFGEKNKEQLLFIHGGGTDYHFYEEFILELAKKYKVYAFSYPGFGKSSHIRTYTIESMTTVIESFVEVMNLNQFILVGHSLGAGLALSYLACYPNRNVTKLVLISPFLVPISDTLFGLLEKLNKQGLLEKDYIPKAKNVEKGKLKVLLKKYRGLNESLNSVRLHAFLRSNDLTSFTKNVKIKTLGVIGLDDIVLSTENQKKGLHLIKNVKILEYKGFGHNVLFAKKKEIAKAIEEL